MKNSRRLPIRNALPRRLIAALALAACGCGFDRLQPPLPNAYPGLTLEQLQTIQDDTRLTNAEKQEQIRIAVNAPMTAAGDQLVNFLFNLNVP